MIKAIIIDWHGVIDKKTFGGFIKEISKQTGKSFLECENLIKDVSNESILGKINTSLGWARVKEGLGINDDQIESLRSYILTIEANNGVVKFLEDSKKKHRIILLSDCPKDKADIIRKSPIAEVFEKLFFSCDLGLSKNNKELFTTVLKESQLKANECLYVDDNESYIKKAAGLGFKVCLFKPNIDLSIALKTVEGP